MNPFERKTLKRKQLIRRIAVACAGVLVALGMALFAFFLPLASLIPSDSIPARAEGELRLHFLPVNGDATVVEFPDGEVLVIDAGSGSLKDNRVLFRCLNALSPQSVSFLITHPDGDHYGGFAALVARYRVKTVYCPVLSSKAIRYQRIMEDARRKGATEKAFTRYDAIDNAGAFLACISPYSEGETDENDASAVLYLHYANVNVLLGGDISSVRERRLLREYALSEHVFDSGGRRIRLEETDILRVSHHGSAYSSCEEWLSMLGAKTAIVSAGAGNRYLHPAAGAIARLASSGADVLRTDELGRITVSIYGGTYKVSYEE